jgi:hypothetical protein
VLTHVHWHRLAMRSREALHHNPQQTGAHRVRAVRLRAGVSFAWTHLCRTATSVARCPLPGDCQALSYAAARLRFAQHVTAR